MKMMGPDGLERNIQKQAFTDRSQGPVSATCLECGDEFDETLGKNHICIHDMVGFHGGIRDEMRLLNSRQWKRMKKRLERGKSHEQAWEITMKFPSDTICNYFGCQHEPRCPLFPYVCGKRDGNSYVNKMYAAFWRGNKVAFDGARLVIIGALYEYREYMAPVIDAGIPCGEGETCHLTKNGELIPGKYG